jgi:hypothetical protein
MAAAEIKILDVGDDGGGGIYKNTKQPTMRFAPALPRPAREKLARDWN